MKAVIFDFSGTLFRCVTAQTWLRSALIAAGIAASDEEISTCAMRLDACGGQPGGHSDVRVPAHLEQLWQRRDIDPPAHKAVYTELMRRADLPWPGIEDLLYDRHWLPESWQPYPDTRAVLELLNERGIPAVVLSNIVSQVRPVFASYRLDDLLAGYVLSFEHGIQKPDPEIFLRACELLGTDPAEVLMVGDSQAADGGATAIGCSFRAVAHLPVSQRPRALLDAVG